MLVCATMYTMAALHYFLSFHWILIDSDNSRQMAHIAASCVVALVAPSPVSQAACETWNQLFQSALNDCVLASLLMVNVRTWQLARGVEH